MNENIKVFFGFVAGAAIGAIVSYFVTEKKLSKDFDLALDEYKNSSEITKEIDDAIGVIYDDEEMTIEVEENKENDNMNQKDIPQEAIDAYKNMQEGVRKAKARREMHNYGNVERDISRPTIDEIDGDNEYNESVKFIKNKPVIVSYEEFDENRPHYRQVDLYFDARDFKLFDDDGAEVEDMGIMVGYDNMEKLADSDESDMYIRNDNLKEYYCVTTEYRID